MPCQKEFLNNCFMKKSTKLSAVYMLIIVFAISCNTIKPSGGSGGSASASNLFETFFVGDSGTQYFIKPIVFVNEDNDELLLDVTFKYRKDVVGKVDYKFSIVNPKVIKDVKSVVISNSNATVNLTDSSLLFNEAKKDLFVSRFSAVSELVDLKNIFDDPNWVIKIDDLKQFVPKPKTVKSIDKLRQSIFVLM